MIRTTAVPGWPVLAPDTTYVWQVRAAAIAAGANLTSAWSEPAEFTVESGTPLLPTVYRPNILSPAAGALTGTKLGFAWSPITGADSYQFVLATDAALSQPVAGTPLELPLPSYQVAGLEPGTTYFWGVKVLEPTPGAQTISTFTTADAPVGSAEVSVEPVPAKVELVVPEQPAPEIVIEVPPQTNGSLLPDAAIWAIVGIGAVLVLAVLILVVAVVVLVVRTKSH